MSQATIERNDYGKLTVYTRSGRKEMESPFDKPVILPAAGNDDP